MSDLSEIMEQLARLVDDLRSQNNCATSIPLFAVMEKHRIYGVSREFTDSFELVEVDDETRKVGYTETDRFVTACLTRAGCKRYIKINGHNLRDPFIYVFSGYRNGEWAFLRAALPVILEALSAPITNPVPPQVQP